MPLVVTILTLFLLPGPVSDLHHSHGQGHSLSPEDEAIMGGFVAAMAVVIASSSLMVAVGGPLILVLTRKVRHLFWTIPTVNGLLYLLVIVVRPYPGGLRAQFQMPGLPYTIIELVLLVLLSLGAATLLASVYMLWRFLKSIPKARANLQPPHEPATRD